MSEISTTYRASAASEQFRSRSWLGIVYAFYAAGPYYPALC